VTRAPEVEVGIGLGANMGDKAANIARAVELLRQRGALDHVEMSSLYKTPPWGVTEQDWFVNACLAGRTTLAPLDLLARMQKIESDMGRVRVEHWGPRLIDLDMLYYGDVVMRTPELTLPHPEMHKRGFVMIPLAEIRPEFVVDGVSARELAAKFAGEGVERIG
jgi:2-amino-4-hydroxy-6-hydroxymethyldihydropteridine diphosphokinase